MVSVTQRIKQVVQPRGGYIKPKDFSITELNDGIALHEAENIHAIIVGLAVDYLSRYIMGTPLQEAFRISLGGAAIVNENDYAEELLNEISGLDDKSIENACKLVGFDTIVRAGIATYKTAANIQPDSSTIFNIRTMVERSRSFFELYGPITQDGFTFQGGYTSLISSGDGDFLTETTLWDFKVSKANPTNKHTLQLFIYYQLGLHSIHDYFNGITKLGIFNPRLNKVYLLNIDDISSEIVSEITSEVIGYKVESHND